MTSMVKSTTPVRKKDRRRGVETLKLKVVWATIMTATSQRRVVIVSVA